MSSTIVDGSATQFETPGLRDWLLLGFGIASFGVLLVYSLNGVGGSDRRDVIDALTLIQAQPASGAAIAPYAVEGPAGAPAGSMLGEAAGT